MRILVVDDSRAIPMMVIHALRRSGVESAAGIEFPTERCATGDTTQFGFVTSESIRR